MRTQVDLMFHDGPGIQQVIGTHDDLSRHKNPWKQLIRFLRV
jgi:hypothetical protein